MRNLNGQILLGVSNSGVPREPGDQAGVEKDEDPGQNPPRRVDQDRSRHSQGPQVQVQDHGPAVYKGHSDSQAFDTFREV